MSSFCIFTNSFISLISVEYYPSYFSIFSNYSFICSASLFTLQQLLELIDLLCLLVFFQFEQWKDCGKGWEERLKEWDLSRDEDGMFSCLEFQDLTQLFLFAMVETCFVGVLLLLGG